MNNFKVGNFMIRLTRIGDEVVATAWRRIDSAFGRYSTITSEDGPDGVEWYGRVATRGPVDERTLALKAGSDERIRAVRESYEREYARAYRVIRAAMRAVDMAGIAGESRLDSGEITFSLEPEGVSS